MSNICVYFLRRKYYRKNDKEKGKEGKKNKSKKSNECLLDRLVNKFENLHVEKWKIILTEKNYINFLIIRHKLN